MDAAFRSFFQFLATVVERIGWPGLLLGCGFYYVEKHATKEQHQRLIEMYFLGQDSHWWPAAVVTLISVLVVLAQRRTYERKLAEKEVRIRELADAKSAYQEERLNRPLHHGAEEEPPIQKKSAGIERNLPEGKSKEEKAKRRKQ